MDVMIDLETLGTKHDAVVLTLGAVKFDPYSEGVTDQTLYFKIDVDQQVTLGREVNDKTVEWWGTQPDVVREEAFSEIDRVSLDDATAQLNKFLVGVTNIWAHGPAFDIVILEDLYRQLGKPIPWNFWQIRDSRTLFCLGVDPRDKNREDLHNALGDSISQALGVQKVFSQLNLKPAFSV